MDTINKHKENFIAAKKERRVKKRTEKRDVTGEEVIFIFEKVLEGWPTIKIFNTIIQTNPKSGVIKKKVEVIATGNCKVFENELEPARYQHYLELRPNVYDFLKKGGVVGAAPLSGALSNLKSENCEYVLVHNIPHTCSP